MMMIYKSVGLNHCGTFSINCCGFWGEATILAGWLTYGGRLLLALDYGIRPRTKESTTTTVVH